MVQSGFYAHFPNLAALLDAIEARLEARVRVPVARRMARLREEGAADPADVALLRAFFADLLAFVGDDPIVAGVYLPLRADTSPVGLRVAACEGRMVADLTDHLGRIMGAAAPGLDRRAACRALARTLMTQAFTLIAAWRRGELPHEGTVALLAEFTAALEPHAVAADLFVPAKAPMGR